MEAYAAFFLTLLNAYLVSAVLVPNPQLPASQLREKAARSSVVRYSNDWAVQIEGGPETANIVATSHGFINAGQVISWDKSELNYSWRSKVKQHFNV